MSAPPAPEGERELKPCPWCDSPKNKPLRIDKMSKYVLCEYCDARAPQAIWNRRASAFPDGRVREAGACGHDYGRVVNGQWRCMICKAALSPSPDGGKGDSSPPLNLPSQGGDGSDLLKEWWRLALVIESAVRHSDAANHPDVLRVIKRTQEAVNSGVLSRSHPGDGGRAEALEAATRLELFVSMRPEAERNDTERDVLVVALALLQKGPNDGRATPGRTP